MMLVLERLLANTMRSSRRAIGCSRRNETAADVSFFFEHAKLGADRGVAGFVGEIREDLAHRSALELVENVHDLAFAAGEGVWLGFSRHVLFSQQLC